MHFDALFVEAGQVGECMFLAFAVFIDIGLSELVEVIGSAFVFGGGGDLHGITFNACYSKIVSEDIEEICLFFVTCGEEVQNMAQKFRLKLEKYDILLRMANDAQDQRNL